MNTRITHYLGHQTFLVAQIIFILFFFQLFVVDVALINGISMEPTLRDNQTVFVDRFSLFVREPKRFEVVQFFHPLEENTLVVKRVIGLPGELVEIRPGEIRITRTDSTSFTLEESYLTHQTQTMIRPGWHDRFLIPNHTFLVLGDNRYFSVDSREYGVVSRDRITGVVMVR